MHEKRVHKFFPTPIFECKIKSYKELNKDLENYIYNLEKEDAKGVKASNEGGWHSPYWQIAKSPEAIKFVDGEKVHDCERSKAQKTCTKICIKKKIFIR